MYTLKAYGQHVNDCFPLNEFPGIGNDSRCRWNSLPFNNSTSFSIYIKHFYIFSSIMFIQTRTMFGMLCSIRYKLSIPHITDFFLSLYRCNANWYIYKLFKNLVKFKGAHGKQYFTHFFTRITNFLLSVNVLKFFHFEPKIILNYS